MQYKIGLKKTEEGYSVWCPGLPGCWSQGETEREAIENIEGCHSNIPGDYRRVNERQNLFPYPNVNLIHDF